LPEEQFGFLPGRSTGGALKVVLDFVGGRLSQGDMTYAAFVDFRKAFDTVPRENLLRVLKEDFEVHGRMFNLIHDILLENYVQIRNGDHTTTQSIKQTIVVAQGDTASPFFYIIYASGLARTLRQIKAKHVFYADDLVIMGPTRQHLQYYLKETAAWCTQNKLQINIEKSKVMRFSNGGSYAKQDRRIQINGRPLEIVNNFSYLGVVLTPRLCFSRHIDEKKIKATSQIMLLGKLTDVDLKTAMNIFRIKIQPILVYCLKELAPYLSVEDLKKLDIVKARYLKRVLGLAANTSATLTFEICGERTLVEDLMINKFPFNTNVLSVYQKFREERNLRFVISNYTEGPAFTGTKWKNSHQVNRAIICRITAHGFHHYLCLKGSCFDIDECVCKWCGECDINRYHLLYCKYLDHDSLTATVNMLSQGNGTL